ncbi:hypothetical protein N7475_008258 [Penicillium sp. IBT 31633x]|nr:hypothetical protein N7475_008258 [Penicillium sp. IBT 31633x]
MNSTSQSSPQQTNTGNAGISSAGVKSTSATAGSSSHDYTEPSQSDAERFQQSIHGIGSWIKPSDLTYPDKFPSSGSL